jgi:hypothetical protein
LRHLFPSDRIAGLLNAKRGLTADEVEQRQPPLRPAAAISAGPFGSELLFSHKVYFSGGAGSGAAAWW